MIAHRPLGCHDRAPQERLTRRVRYPCDNPSRRWECEWSFPVTCRPRRIEPSERRIRFSRHMLGFSAALSQIAHLLCSCVEATLFRFAPRNSGSRPLQSGTPSSPTRSRAPDTFRPLNDFLPVRPWEFAELRANVETQRRSTAGPPPRVPPVRFRPCRYCAAICQFAGGEGNRSARNGDATKRIPVSAFNRAMPAT